MSHPPFIIYGLPRSRTAWLSAFLTYRDWVCGHDELRHVRSLADARPWFSQPCTGTVETGAAPWWRLVQTYRPDIQVVVVRRPVAEVVESCIRAGFGERAPMTVAMTRLDRKLDQIERRVRGAISVRYSDLADEAVCAGIFEHCLPYRHDHRWWASFASVNIQISARGMMRYCAAYRDALAKAAKQAKWQSIAAMTAAASGGIDGMVFREESVDSAFPDATRLFREHCVIIGDEPDAYLNRNVATVRGLESFGSLQIMTARLNGRMFGYLMSIIAPSLDNAAETSAMQTLFFASGDFPGLGLKLQRASISALAARGVDEVMFRAGVRGCGPRTGALYRRLGAVEDGQMFKLRLGGY